MAIDVSSVSSVVYFENVFLHFNQGSVSSMTGGIARYLNNNTSISLTNTFIWVEQAVSRGDYKYGALFAHSQSSNDPPMTVSQSYVLMPSITRYTLCGIDGSSKYGTQQALIQAFNSQMVVNTASAFNKDTSNYNDYWDTDTYYIPVMASAKAFLSDSAKSTIAK